jgi:NitT/TauT family transport system substrate-binding protein
MRKLCTALLLTFCVQASSTAAMAAEKVSVAIISFSPYAAWYIARDKGMYKDIDLDIKIIEGLAEKNAALASGQVQCINNTVDTLVLARAGDLPIKVVAYSNMSYGLDKMVVTEGINSVKDFKGKRYGSDYGFLNHMWMLMTLRREGMNFNDATQVSMLPQESAAAFASGGLDIDVNYDPFVAQSQKLAGSKVLKTSLTDRTWERGLISDGIGCNEKWLKEKPAVAKELLRGWFEAVNWWKENPAEGNAIIAKGLGWPVSDVKLNQHGAIQLNLSQNLGAFGVGGKPLCESLPEEAPKAPEGKGWGEVFGGPDCVPGYGPATWDMFSAVYNEAGVAQKKVAASEGLDPSHLQSLDADGFTEKYNSNKWIGRLGLGE